MSSNYFFPWFIGCGRKINCALLLFWSSSHRKEATRVDRPGASVDGKKARELGGHYASEVGAVKRVVAADAATLTSALRKPKSLRYVDITFASFTGAIIVN